MMKTETNLTAVLLPAARTTLTADQMILSLFLNPAARTTLTANQMILTEGAVVQVNVPTLMTLTADQTILTEGAVVRVNVPTPTTLTVIPTILEIRMISVVTKTMKLLMVVTILRSMTTRWLSRRS